MRRLLIGLGAVVLCVIAIALVLRGRAAPPSVAGANAGEPNATAAVASTTDETTSAVVTRGEIAGRVTDQAGHPVAGALVCASASSPKLVTADLVAPRCAKSGADGAYRIADLLAATYAVAASAASFEPARYRDRARESSTFILHRAETKTGIDLVLTRGGVEIRGRVKDISGGLVRGALVDVAVGEMWTENAKLLATSDAQGEWSVWAKAGTVTANALADGYTTGTAHGVAPGQVIEIILTPESVLQGRVVEAGTDTPVPGARVTAGSLATTIEFGPNQGGVGHSALTDAEGRFRIRGLDPGRYKPVATTPHRWGDAAESVLLGLAETSREIVIEVHSTPSVSGRIMNGDQPCPEGSVNLEDKQSHEMRSGETDAEGRVRIDGLVPGTYAVQAWCHNAASADKYDPIKVADKDITGVVWKVTAGLTASGIVVDDKGAPVPHATVNVESKGGDPRSQKAWGTSETSDDGTFRIRGLIAATYGLTVHREGITPLKDPFEVAVQHDVDGVRVVLPAGGGIAGVVVDEAGAPAPGIEVRARGDRWRWMANQTKSRDDGTFSLPGVNPGDYHVLAQKHWSVVRAPGTKDDDEQGVAARVVAGETTKVKLVVEAQSGVIHGRVVDEGGVALSDAFIDAQRQPERTGAAAGEARRQMQWQWGDTRSPVLTDTDGNFTVTKLSPGTYTLRAFRKGGGETVLEDVALGSTVTLKIRTEGAISGTLLDAKGKAPERFSITILDPKTGVTRAETFFRTKGAWSTRDLPAGDYDVTAEARGRAAAHVALGQGEKKDGVALTLEPNASVRGRVVSLDTGEPLAGNFVTVRPAKGDNSFLMLNDSDDRKNITDADGRFEVEEAPAGRVIVMVFPRDFMDADYSNANVPATVSPGAVAELPPIALARARVKGETSGDLGFANKAGDPAADLADTRFVVSLVRPGGPAAKAGLLPGDEIVAIDGHDVVGANGYLYWPLSRVPEGASVKLGLRRSATIAITAAHAR